MTEIECHIRLIVTTITGLNLLGQEAIEAMELSVDQVLNSASRSSSFVKKVFDDLHPNVKLQERYQNLAENLRNLFKPELGCHRKVELEIKFKPET